uniref:Uncharacterized protein n=1 Tax=Trieres chinensis TaxID=1514140 RepID=A0A7S1ZSS5_TRICV
MVLHRWVRDVDLTKRIVCDLWRLIVPRDLKKIRRTLSRMEPEMLLVAAPDDREGDTNKLQIPSLRLDDMLEELYDEDQGPAFNGIMQGLGEKFARGKIRLTRGNKK